MLAARVLHEASTVLTLCLALALAGIARADEEPVAIDLPTVLRLAGAQNLDVQIAREALQKAKASRAIAVEKFFPWLAVGATYHRRDGFAQAVPAGTISSTHFDSYAPGGTLNAQVAVGDAIYETLAAKQLVHASEHGLDAQTQDSSLEAVAAYFDLVRARAVIGVAEQAVATSADYQRQLHEAVAVGIAFQGDEMRVQTQTEQYRIGVTQAREQTRIAAARLARALNLDPTVTLTPADPGLDPLEGLSPEVSMGSLVERALRERPEIAGSAAAIAAADAIEDAARYGPLVPSVGAQVFVGALGGGRDGQETHLGASQDYLFGLSWRLGTGGLFDFGRIDAARAQAATARLNGEKTANDVKTDVVTSLTRVRSLAQQIELARTSLASATDTLRLTRERKQYGVGIVLEEIQAQQALNQTRADYVTKIADFNKAQFALARAVGQPLDAGGHAVASSAAALPLP
jgi:outer membrane protein TolC